MLAFRLHITAVALVTGGGDEDHVSVREGLNHYAKPQACKLQVDAACLHVFIIRDHQAHINHDIPAVQIPSSKQALQYLVQLLSEDLHGASTVIVEHTDALYAGVGRDIPDD